MLDSCFSPQGHVNILNIYNQDASKYTAMELSWDICFSLVFYLHVATLRS